MTTDKLTLWKDWLDLDIRQQSAEAKSSNALVLPSANTAKDIAAPTSKQTNNSNGLVIYNPTKPLLLQISFMKRADLPKSSR